MNLSPRGRVLPTFAAAGLALILVILVASPASADSVVGNPVYKYKVIGFDYAAHAELTAANIGATCTPADAEFKGSVKSSSDVELAPLTLGTGGVKIKGQGTEGSIDAETAVLFNFDATHFEVTACDEFGSISTFTNSSCTDKEEATVRANVTIDGGVGKSVKLDWSISLFGSPGTLVPDTFSCGQPFMFATEGSGCKQKSASLEELGGQRLRLPFKCLLKATSSPGRAYTRYAAVSNATGALYLKRILPHH